MLATLSKLVEAFISAPGRAALRVVAVCLSEQLLVSMAARLRCWPEKVQLAMVGAFVSGLVQHLKRVVQWMS